MLSLERMTRISASILRTALSSLNRVLECRGAKVAAANGFFWPPDPSSSAYCSIGGNLATTPAARMRVKYGPPRPALLGAGSDRRRRDHPYRFYNQQFGGLRSASDALLVGSEGTPTIITEATSLQPCRRMLPVLLRDIATRRDVPLRSASCSNRSSRLRWSFSMRKHWGCCGNTIPICLPGDSAAMLMIGNRRQPG